MRIGQGVRTGLGHGGITFVLQTQFSVVFFQTWILLKNEKKKSLTLATPHSLLSQWPEFLFWLDLDSL